MKSFTVNRLAGGVLACLLGMPGLHAAGTYENPVRALDLPDPSLIRTAEGYWATATSGNWAPHFPLLFSRDLVNWEIKGAIFQQPPAWIKGNFWAPEITEDKGTYFVYYTARRHDDRLAVAVATAKKPEGPYTDHGELVAQEMGSIDAMAFTDNEGVRWLLWKEDGNDKKKPTWIYLQRLSEDGLKLVGERRAIMTNDTPWEDKVVEGPFVLRHGDFYYLFYSGAGCCDRNCNYGLGVARAKRMEGPWEKCPANPLMASNDAWRCPGHGSITQDASGRYWLLYHSYAQRGFIATGRQLLLDEVVFNADGWPSINRGEGPSRQAAAPASAAPQRDSRSLVDQFDAGAALKMGWQWPMGREVGAELKGGWLKLTADSSPAVVVQSSRNPSFLAETSLEVPAQGEAGLAIYGNPATYIALLAQPGRVRVVMGELSQEKEIFSATLSGEGPLKLRVSSDDGIRFRFAYAEAAGEWKEISAGGGGHSAPPWDRAVRIGLRVAGPKGSAARFDYFGLRENGGDLLSRGLLP
jgi:xylan 1,4-beta-xylosidase